MRTTLLIPCYNEEAGIAQLCQRLRPVVDDLGGAAEVEILFVNDGSTDRTAAALADEAKGLPYRVVSHAHNRGLGAALQTGFAASSGDFVVTLDSDCTYDPAGATDLLAAIEAGASVATGSPYHPQGEVVGVQAWRLVLSKTLSRLYWLLLPQRLHTYTSCFRAYRREILPRLEAPDPGFLGVTQLLVSAILQGEQVAEIPSRLTVRRFGQSKIRVVRVSLSHLNYLRQILQGQWTRQERPAPVAQTDSPPHSRGRAS